MKFISNLNILNISMYRTKNINVKAFPYYPSGMDYGYTRFDNVIFFWISLSHKATYGMIL